MVFIVPIIQPCMANNIKQANIQTYFLHHSIFSKFTLDFLQVIVKTPIGFHLKSKINPFKPNGISKYYQWDQSISVSRVVRRYFSFLFKFQYAGIWANSKDPDQRPLTLVCTVCLCPAKKTLGIIGLRNSL